VNSVVLICVGKEGVWEQRRKKKNEESQRKVTASATASSEGNLIILFDFPSIKIDPQLLLSQFHFHILLFFTLQIKFNHPIFAFFLVPILFNLSVFLLYTAMQSQNQNFRFHVCAVNRLSDFPNQGIVMFWFCWLRCCRWSMIKIWVSLPIFLASSSLCWW